MAATNFRLIDQISLAVERGNSDVLERLCDLTICGLGPIVETTIFEHTLRPLSSLTSCYQAKGVSDAMEKAKNTPLRPFFGSSEGQSWGALWFRESNEEEWRLSLHAFQLALQKALQFKRKMSSTKKLICGAISEIVDNIFDHSGAPATGITAFLGTPESVEIVVGDAGMGILASLQTNPKFSYLRDAGTAMAEALKEGNSRYGPSLDRGYGFSTLFHSLNTIDAELRFRSGDYALEIAGTSPSNRNLRISQKAELRGFVTSIRVIL